MGLTLNHAPQPSGGLARSPAVIPTAAGNSGKPGARTATLPGAAAGTSGDRGLAEACLGLTGDASPLVRGAASWALSRLADPAAFAALAAREVLREHDVEVLAEWKSALAAARLPEGAAA